MSYPAAECHTGHDVTSELGQATGEPSQPPSRDMIEHVFTLVEKGLRDARAIRTFFGVEYSQVSKYCALDLV